MLYRFVSSRLSARNLYAACFAVVTLGCGSSTTNPNAESKTVGGTAAVVAAGPINIDDATKTVAQFLDAVRRGGETGGANQLLTEQAQLVLKQLGRSVQPLGAPDAVYKVTRAEAVPDTPKAALVHCYWTEPNSQGQNETVQVVWAVEYEAAGWRISGLAIDHQPGSEPAIIDFENATQMAAMLNDAEESIATAPTETTKF